ncbi:hypothetical protein PG991_002931 [Apiospora marii]|uniref:Uncharacterized protein n=1 Tax=Apiospora marii TaxID=335849 RepID=A0ABR1SGU0_9PEZI
MNSAANYSRVVITPNSPISASAPSDFCVSHHDPSMATLPRDAPPRASPPPQPLPPTLDEHPGQAHVAVDHLVGRVDRRHGPLPRLFVT